MNSQTPHLRFRPANRCGAVIALKKPLHPLAVQANGHGDIDQNLSLPDVLALKEVVAEQYHHSPTAGDPMHYLIRPDGLLRPMRWPP